MPVPSANGRAPNKAAIVVIRIGRKRNMQASKMESIGFFPSLRSTSSAKSIIIMAFFLTIPMSSTMPMMEMMFRSTPKSINASIAPTLADGSVEMIVSGCTRLSYKIPRTIYTASSAVTISMVPAKKPCSVLGAPIRFCIWSMASVASLKDLFVARLKDTVTDGNKPVWLIASGVVFAWLVATASRGILLVPLLVVAVCR